MSDQRQERRAENWKEEARRLRDRLARLEDGIRGLVNEIEPDDSVPHWVFRRIETLLDGE